MGTSQSRDSLPEGTVSPGSDNSSIPDIPSPTIVLEQESYEAPAEESSVEQPPAEESPVEQPPAEKSPVEQSPAEESPVQPPAEESPVEQPPAEESPAPTPDVAVSESQPTTIQTPVINHAAVHSSMSDMIRDGIIKHNLPRNVKISFKLKPVSYTINRESDKKPSEKTPDVIEMAEATPVAAPVKTEEVKVEEVKVEEVKVEEVQAEEVIAESVAEPVIEPVAAEPVIEEAVQETQEVDESRSEDS